MLSIQEIKLLLEKLERLEKEDWQGFIKDFKDKLQKLANSIDLYNEQQISSVDKTLDWYQQDLDNERNKTHAWDDLLDKAIYTKINQFAKMGNVLQNCVEIGPGYGRYTRMLLAWRLIFLIDVLPHTKSKIFKLFPPKHQKLLRFYTTDRTSCPDIPDHSCNFAFSWNTFTFFTQEHIYEYLRDINRMILPGGYAFIHYADCNYDQDLHEAKRGYWNFNTRERMSEMVKNSGYEIIEQSQFRPCANYIIFKKPGNLNPAVYKITEISPKK